jgi:hypothetical protein
MYQYTLRVSRQFFERQIVQMLVSETTDFTQTHIAGATNVAPLAAFRSRHAMESAGNACGPVPGLASRPLAPES